MFFFILEAVSLFISFLLPWRVYFFSTINECPSPLTFPCVLLGSRRLKGEIYLWSPQRKHGEAYITSAQQQQAGSKQRKKRLHFYWLALTHVHLTYLHSCMLTHAIHMHSSMLSHGYMCIFCSASPLDSRFMSLTHPQMLWALTQFAVVLHVCPILCSGH